MKPAERFFSKTSIIIVLNLNKSINLWSVPVNTLEDKVRDEEEKEQLSFPFLSCISRTDQTEMAAEDVEITGT